MTNQEFITKLLDINQPMEEMPTRFSTIALLLRGARKLTGCDLNSGKYEMNELFNKENFLDQTYHSFQLSGLINYLIFLDQIGSTFKPKDKSPIRITNGVFCALKYFSTVDDPKIQTIRALRNSLAHQFGLATKEDPDLKPPRKFSLSTKRNADIIILPTKEWDGTFPINRTILRQQFSS